jgi:hypothetical protein
MNWDAVAAIAELAGALAVVVSMLILAYQIRESNRVSKAEAIRARGERMVDLWFRVAESERLSSAAGPAIFENKSMEDLPLEGQRIMHMVVRSLTLVWESEYLENVHGALDDAIWARRLGSIAALLEKPVYSTVWADVRSLLTDDFVGQVEEVRRSLLKGAEQGSGEAS